MKSEACLLLGVFPTRWGGCQSIGARARRPGHPETIDGNHPTNVKVQTTLHGMLFLSLKNFLGLYQGGGREKFLNQCSRVDGSPFAVLPMGFRR